MGRPRLYPIGTVGPNDVLYCDVCNKEYTRAHKSRHVKSNKHKNALRNKIQTKDIDMSADKKETKTKKKKEHALGYIEDQKIYLESVNDDYFFKIGDQLVKEIETETEEIKPLPQTINPRSVIYVCGKSNSGKSTFCREYIGEYMKLFPKRDVYIVLKDDMDKDKAFKGLDKKNIFYPPLDTFLEEVKMEEFPDGSLILLDDIDYIGDKIIKENLFKLKNEIMGAGSKRKISLVLTSHLINKGHSTREIINEMNQVVLFPAGCLNLDYFLEHYLGFSKDDIKDVKKLKTRYILINNGVPQYLLSKHKLYML